MTTTTTPTPPSTDAPHGRQLARRVGWGVADQGISSLGNFALGVILAHTLDVEEFGAFGLAFVAFGFVISAVRGPSTDPLLVRFSGAPDAAWRRAVAAASGCALLGGVLTGLGCLVVGLLLPGTLGHAFLALGVGLPGIMLQDSYRFAFFSCGKGQHAFANDLLWGVLQVGGLLVLLEVGDVGVTTALLVFGASAAVAALVGMAQTRVAPAPWLARSWLVDHRSLGGRFLIENVCIGGARQVRISAVGLVAGVAAVGEIRAAEILMGPFMVLLSGVSQVSIPEAKQVIATAPERLVRFCLRLASVQAAAAVLWAGVALVVLPLGIGELLLGELWPSAEKLVLPMAIVLALGCYQNAGSAGIRALGAARRSLNAQLVNAGLTLVLGVAGAFAGGAEGSCWGLAAGTFLGVLVWGQQLRRALREHLDDDPVPSPVLSPAPSAPGDGTADQPRRARTELRNVQGLRGVAAFVVVFAHISGADGLEQHLFGHSWMSWANLPANTGVDLFFVISGLIMTVTTWRTFDTKGAARRFAWRRLTRILPLYWLVNTAMILAVVVLPSDTSFGHSGSLGAWQSYLLLPRTDRMPVLVAWTLAYEMFFYLLFTLALLLRRRWLGWVVGGWAAVTVALHVVVGSTGSPYLELVSSPLNLEFALGVAVGLAVVTGWIIRPGLFLAVGVAAVAAVWVRLGSSGWTEFPSTTYRLLGPGVAMAFVVYGAVGVELRRRVVCPAWLQRLGDASYSLYLVHVPAITALGLVLVRWTPDTPWAHAVVLVAVPLYVVGLARLSYVLVERPVQRFFRRWPRSRRDAQPDRHPAPAPVVQRGLDSSLPQIGDMEPVRPDERQRPGTLAARG